MDKIESKILHLNVKRIWFDLIALEIKKRDYRDMKPYWYERLWHSVKNPKEYDYVDIRNGYRWDAPRVLCKFEGVDLVHAQTLVTYKVPHLNKEIKLIPGSSYGINLGEILEVGNWTEPAQLKVKDYYYKSDL